MSHIHTHILTPWAPVGAKMSQKHLCFSSICLISFLSLSSLFTVLYPCSVSALSAIFQFSLSDLSSLYTISSLSFYDLNSFRSRSAISAQSRPPLFSQSILCSTYSFLPNLTSLRAFRANLITENRTTVHTAGKHSFPTVSISTNLRP